MSVMKTHDCHCSSYDQSRATSTTLHGQETNNQMVWMRQNFSCEMKHRNTVCIMYVDVN